MKVQTREAVAAQRLTTEANKAAAVAATAKQQVRAAKAQLKQARKLAKVSKKAAKLAKREAEAALATLKISERNQAAAAAKAAGATKLAAVKTSALSKKPPARDRGSAKVRAKSSKQSLRAVSASASPEEKSERSAAEVARSVIERLESAPPKLSLTPTHAPNLGPAPALEQIPASKSPPKTTSKPIAKAARQIGKPTATPTGKKPTTPMPVASAAIQSVGHDPGKKTGDHDA